MIISLSPLRGFGDVGAPLSGGCDPLCGSSPPAIRFRPVGALGFVVIHVSGGFTPGYTLAPLTGLIWIYIFHFYPMINLK